MDKFKRFLHVKYPLWLSIIVTAVVPVLSYYLMELMTHSPNTIPFQLQLMGWLFCWIMTALVFFISGRMNISLIIPLIFTAVVGLANYFVIEFRSSPILPWDLTSIGTAAAVAGNYEYEFTPQLVLIIVCFVLLALVSTKVNITLKRKPVKRVAGTAVTIAVLAVYVLCLQNETVTDFLDVYYSPFTQGTAYKKNGFYVSFIYNTQYLIVEKPEGYSAEAAEEILASVAESTDDDDADGGDDEDETTSYPNIIVIMDESFSDLSVIGDFETTEDYMPYISSLMGSENTISGSLYVSVMGGNTANSEFEFLTGSTMAFLPTGSIPYQQYITSETVSLASILTEYGYNNVAIHPYGATGWKRNTVYPLLGFTYSLFNTDMDYTALVRKYISDESAFNQIIAEYEAADEDSPFFAFCVTMQNHGSYSGEWDNFERTITVTDMDDLSLPRVNAYLTLLKYTDEAFEDLIEYFENCGEDTIILFFGDHQPKVEDSFIEALYGKDLDDVTDEEFVTRYITPFIIWANFDIEEAEDVMISANYLSSLLMDAAGLEKTTYQEFLSELYEVLPVLTANFAIDADGNFYSATDFDQLEDLLSDYEILQYYNIFDTSNNSTEYFLP